MSIKIINVSESELNVGKYLPNHVVFLMIRYNDEYLLKREFVGGHWELPATGPIKRPNETPRECVMRNYGEKYELYNSEVKFVGVSNVVFEKSHINPDPKPEYLALFETFIDNKNDIMKRLDENLHIWYIWGDDISPYCNLCRMLIEHRDAAKT